MLYPLSYERRRVVQRPERNECSPLPVLPGWRFCDHEPMTSWADFEDAEPEFARRVRELFTSHKHHTMATIRRDGSPRISGTEVDFSDGELVLGVMSGARRAADLRRDPRLALHTHTADPPEEDPSTWCGDAKVSGVAVEQPSDGSHRFRVELGEVILTTVGTPADHLVIASWRHDRGLLRFDRR